MVAASILLVALAAASLTRPRTVASKLDQLLGPLGLGFLVAIMVLGVLGILLNDHRRWRRAYAVIVGLSMAALGSGILTDVAGAVLSAPGAR
jgi:predicted membrane protein